MAEVVKTILDGDGEPFTMRFWEDDAGNLTPLHRIAPESTVVLSGSSVDLRGLAASKPDADAVDVGVTYWSVDTGEVEVSDGTNWNAV